MTPALPRGTISHSVGEDIAALATACFAKLDDPAPVTQLEDAFAAYVGRDHAVAFPFARVAIHAALRAQNFPAGSEILMPALSIKGILEVVQSLGLRAVFVDSSLDTFAFDPNAAARAITPNTRAMLITPLFGMIPDMDRLMDLAQAHDLFVIEDFSQCLGGTFNGQRIGSFGDVGVYSASSIKTLDTFGGGLLVCDDPETARAMRTAQTELAAPSRAHLIKKIAVNLIRNVATSQPVFTLATYPFLRSMIRRNPEAALKQTGARDRTVRTDLPSAWFERYTTLQARLGLRWLARVDAINAEKRAIIADYETHVPALRPQARNLPVDPVYWQYPILVDDTLTANTHFAAHRIDTATSSLVRIHDLDTPDRAPCPNAAQIHDKALFLPSHAGLSAQARRRVADAVAAWLGART